MEIIKESSNIIAYYTTDINNYNVVESDISLVTSHDIGIFPALNNVFTGLSGHYTFRETNNGEVKYNAVPFMKYDPSLIAHNPMVTTNDLMMGTTKIILNLTSAPITVVDRNESRKVFHTIEKEGLEKLSGKILIFEVITMNRPDTIRAVYGIDNYLETLANKLRGSSRSESARVCRTIDNYEQAAYVFNKTPNRIEDAYSRNNCIKLIRLKIIDTVQVSIMNNGETLFLEEYEYAISRANICEAELNPNSIDKFSLTEETLNALESEQVITYIIDNDGYASPKFINIGRQHTRVPNVTSSRRENDKDRREDGFYIVRVGNGIEEVILHETVEQAVENKHIFNTMEEAIDGCNLEKKLREQYETQERLYREKKLVTDEKLIEQKAIAQEFKMKHEQEMREKEIHAAQIEAERKREDFERSQKEAREKHIRDKEYAELKAKLEKEKEEYKRKLDEEENQRAKEHDAWKHKCDQEKQDKENLMMGLKVAAGVTGFVATVYALYKKLS